MPAGQRWGKHQTMWGERTVVPPPVFACPMGPTIVLCGFCVLRLTRGEAGGSG